VTPDHETRIVLFNGPPGCGKDTAARLVLDDPWVQEHYRRHFERFAMPLKKCMSGLFDREVDLFGVSVFERDKDVANSAMLGRSYRSLQIRFGMWLWDVLGKNALGILLGRRLTRWRVLNDELIDDERPLLVVVPDLGREEDVTGLLEYFHPEQILVVQLTRIGTSFEGDIRGFVTSPELRNLKRIENNGTEHALHEAVMHEVKGFLRQKRRAA